MIPVLKGIEDQAKLLEGDTKVSDAQREAIMDDFLSGLLDRIKFEFVPSLGSAKVKNPQALLSDPKPDQKPKQATPDKGGKK